MCSASGPSRHLTKPLPTGSPVLAMTMGIVVVAFCAARIAGDASVTIMSTFKRTSSATRPGKRSKIAIGKAPLDNQVPALDIPKVPHPLQECTDV